ncbi:hypothetical protein Tco_0549405 [Tanacetum coccineum]
MQTHASKVDSSKALGTDLVVRESNGIESRKQDTRSSLENYHTHVVDADITPVNDQVPFAEVDSNTTPNSTNMCHSGGEIDQDAEQYQVSGYFKALLSDGKVKSVLSRLLIGKQAIKPRGSEEAHE